MNKDQNNKKDRTSLKAADVVSKQLTKNGFIRLRTLKIFFPRTGTHIHKPGV
ncbi:hypothetical protein ACX0G7_21150 [Flavitalea antarctica]